MSLRPSRSQQVAQDTFRALHVAHPENDFRVGRRRSLGGGEKRTGSLAEEVCGAGHSVVITSAFATQVLAKEFCVSEISAAEADIESSSLPVK